MKLPEMRAAREVAVDDHHWGASAVDLQGKDLPSLKAAFLVACLPERGRILEIGCGEEKILRTIACHRPSLQLEGCDVRQPTFPEYRFRLVAGDGTLPYGEGEFEAVVVSDCLEHVPDPDRYLAEVVRVLKPGGHFVACVPTEGQPVSFYRLYRHLLGDDVYMRTKEHIQSFTRVGLLALIRRHFGNDMRIRYAYHFAGHFMDATFFAAQRMPFLRNFWWHDNQYYNAKPANPDLLTRVLNAALQFGNAVAWLESRLFSRVPLTSAALLIDVIRR